MLTTHCRKPSGGFIKNIIRFLPHDIISNNNGRLIGNTNTNFSFSEGSGFYIYNNKVYCVSKYAGYNTERHILGGNDFANMFSSNNIFN